MTYHVKTTMPDGNTPDFPPMTKDQLIQYLKDVKATGWDEEDFPETGQATCAYENPGDTTVEWSPSDS